MPSTVLLGTTRRGTEVRLPARARATHMHVVGASGRGKGKFLEHLIRRDVLAGNGLCLIDPHGYLYDDLIRWCEMKGFLGRKPIVLFDPAAEGWSFGFNPLDFGAGEEIPFAVDAMVKACAQVWGGEDTTKTPLLKRALRLVYHVLAEKRLTLLEAHSLTQPTDPGGLRRYLTRDIRDPIIAAEWAALNAFPPSRLDEFFSSTNNRLLEFLASELVRRIIGQRERVIDFGRLMDEGAIILVNLACRGRISDDNARLLGTLLVNDLFLKARHRAPGSRPFYLYIDECSLFVNDDLARILDEARKFGLHLILAHQHLSQLRTVSERVYSAVMTNAQTKVVFGGLSPDDAEVMARSVFMGEYDLEEVKHTYDSQQVVRYVRTWLKSYSEGESHGSSLSEGATAGGSSSEDEQGRVVATDSWSTSRASTSSSGSSRSSGAHEALMPVLATRPTTGYSLEEQIYRSMAIMVNQPTRHAIVKLPMQRSRRIETPEVTPAAPSRERVQRFQERAFRLCDFASPAEAVSRELAARHEELSAAAKLPAPAVPPEPASPAAFRE